MRRVLRGRSAGSVAQARDDRKIGPLDLTHGETTSGSTTPVWFSTVYQPTLQPLQSDLSCDVCVVGGGIAGMTAAYLLAKAGKKVVLLEDGRIGSGETGRTTAHLSNEMDDRYLNIEQLHGAKGARMAADSHSAAIDEIERISRYEGIECEFTRLDGYLFAPPGASPGILERELQACRRAGVQAYGVDRAPIHGFDTGPALLFPRQAQIHPLKYLIGLAAAFLRSGGSINNGTHVTAVEDSDEKHGCKVRTATGHTVTARDVVVATNTPVSSWVRLPLKQAPYRTYVIGCRVPRGEVELALFWDTEDPYHYVRLHRPLLVEEDDVLIVGGEDHKTGQEDDAGARYARLAAWAMERFPVRSVEFRWSGQVMEPADGMAFIGLNPGSRHVYIITGDSGQGMTHGTLGGMLVRDLILGRKNEWARLYDPLRLTVRSIGELAAENLNVARQYVDWLTPGETGDERKVNKGEGMILREGARKVACYRDGAGMLYKMSAVCTHLGCIVRWNSGEQSWDCPCHGSRFDPHGKVICGPAITGLEPLNKSTQDIRAAHSYRRTAASSAKRSRRE